MALRTARISARIRRVIHVQDFHKNYDRTIAVAGLTFDVQPGQILGLLGPNGAGKTTTMRAICGITPATQGRLIVAGHDVASAPVEAKRNLAYVPDDPKLFDALTVAEHLEFTAAAYDVRDYKPHAEQLMAQFELVEQRGKLAQELSRGMRQKVAICCAYLHLPRAILVDEPLTGLDPRGIRTMNQSLRDQASRGAAVIISSHLLALVEGLCTHLLILHRGRSLYFGPADSALAAFEVSGTDTTLEEVFFRITENDGQNDLSIPRESPVATDPASLPASRP
ncbi:ABC transporter ATP-binding protein [soil metagenome]